MKIEKENVMLWAKAMIWTSVVLVSFYALAKTLPNTPHTKGKTFTVSCTCACEPETNKRTE